MIKRLINRKKNKIEINDIDYNFNKITFNLSRKNIYFFINNLSFIILNKY